MFAKLTGIVDTIGDEYVVLDVSGVGYLVFASGKTLQSLQNGAPASLLIETQVGEDHIRLYGFQSKDEQHWFRLLQSVQGVGAKVALSLLSLLTPADLTRAIAAQDKARLSQANGVGPKLALRLITELKDKTGGLSLSAPSGAIGAPSDVMHRTRKDSPAIADALSALINLGYRPAEAEAAVRAALAKTGEEVLVSVLIKAALQEASR